LLLNRQITAEATSTWRKQTPLTITEPFPLIVIPLQRAKANPAGILSRTTAQAVSHIQILIDLTVEYPDHYNWYPTLAFFRDAWAEQSKLEVLKFRVVDSPKPSWTARHCAASFDLRSNIHGAVSLGMTVL
jgi:hypothetical protein